MPKSADRQNYRAVGPFALANCRTATYIVIVPRNDTPAQRACGAGGTGGVPRGPGVRPTVCLADDGNLYLGAGPAALKSAAAVAGRIVGHHVQRVVARVAERGGGGGPLGI